MQRIKCRGSVEICVVNKRGQIVMCPFSRSSIYDLKRDIVRYTLEKIKSDLPAKRGHIWLEAPYKPATDPVSQMEAA